MTNQAPHSQSAGSQHEGASMSMSSHDQQDVSTGQRGDGELREALAWYGEQARLARLIHSEGDSGRHALEADGGKRAQAALANHPLKVGERGHIPAGCLEFNRRKLERFKAAFEGGGTYDDGDISFLLRMAELGLAAPMASIISDKSTSKSYETDALVDRFGIALKERLRASEKKYGFQNGWLGKGWAANCRRDLALHVAKGDPLDVAAYTAFCWHHGWLTYAPRVHAEGKEGKIKPTPAGEAAYQARFPGTLLADCEDWAVAAWSGVAEAVLAAQVVRAPRPTAQVKGGAA